jgi:hypothetical protein
MEWKKGEEVLENGEEVDRREEVYGFGLDSHELESDLESEWTILAAVRRIAGLTHNSDITLYSMIDYATKISW